jgi:hypothetical protein
LAGQETIFQVESPYNSSSSSSVRYSAARESSSRTSLSGVTKQVLILPNDSKNISQGSDDSIQADLRNINRDSSLHNKLECRRIVLEQDEVAENAGRRFEASQSKELQGTIYPEENVEKRGELNVQHDVEEEVENSIGIGIEKEGMGRLRR